MEHKVTAIIQARMTSTRLPGKVLMEVMSRPLLSYQIERLRFSNRIDEIIIATTTNKEDDRIAGLSQKEELKVYRGSEDDVLDRYYQTAKKYKTGNILRITADCPLIDPNICDRIINVYLNSGADYVHTGESFAEGLDCGIISFRALSTAWHEAKLKSEREHVTLYIKNHPEKFDNITVENETDDRNYRITVDEQKDFIVVKAIFEDLYKETKSSFTVREIKSFLDNNPEIYTLNANIIRNEGLLKSLLEDKNK